MQQTEHIGVWINIASHCIRRNIDSCSAKYGLSGIQSRILCHLQCARENGQDVFQRDIEKTFGIRRSSVTSVISHLEERGYLTRMAVSNDARLKKLVITEKGLAADRQIRQQIDRFEASLNACFNAGEQQQLLQMLKTIVQTLNDGSAGTCPTIKSNQEDDNLC